MLMNSERGSFVISPEETYLTATLAISGSGGPSIPPSLMSPFITFNSEWKRLEEMSTSGVDFSRSLLTRVKMKTTNDLALAR